MRDPTHPSHLVILVVAVNIAVTAQSRDRSDLGEIIYPREGDRPKPWEVNLLPLLPAAVVPPVVALASGPPQSSGSVVRARMIRTWRLRRITGRSKS